jgi:hypothetical protein
MLQPFITPSYSPDLSLSAYFLFPKFKTKLKELHFWDVADIQEAVSDELKKVQKEFSRLLRNCLTAQKPVYTYANGAYFGFKKKYVSSTRVFVF